MAIREKVNISDKPASGLSGLPRSVLHYDAKPATRMRCSRRVWWRLAHERRRFGYRRLHALVEREGTHANHKRIYRLYREAGLAVRRRRKRHGVMIEREQLALPGAPNEVWSIDFVMDALSNGRRVKCLTVVDDFTKGLSTSSSTMASQVCMSLGHWTVQLASVAIPRRCEQARDPNLRAARLTSGRMRTASR
ncbi:HTH-like domain protein [Burkholderia mallei]|nr:HTH-like domain protein [Burkholderia mallei]